MHTCTALLQLKDLTNTSAALEERVHELERAEQQLQCQLQQQVWTAERIARVSGRLFACLHVRER
jgi:hypothetical protein